MPLGSGHQTTTTAANFIPEVWSKEVKMAVEQSLVFANLVKRFDMDVAQFGDTIHIPDLSNLVANNKTAQTSVTLQAPTEGVTNISINQHKETSFIVEDIVSAQSQYDLQSMYTQKSGYAIAEAIDDSVAGLYAGLSQTTGSGASALADADILGGIELLDEANAPMNDRSFVIRPAAKADILALDKFALVNESGSSMGLRNGEIGDIYGVKVFMTTNTPTVTTVAHNVLFQKEAFALAMQVNPRVQSQYKQEYLGNLVTVDTLYGVLEYRDTFGVDVQSLD